MSLFNVGFFKLSAGGESSYKIDCDALTDDDIEAAATLMSLIVPPFDVVHGIPTGGDRLAAALRDHVTPETNQTLIVDDVYTTGSSMNTALRAVAKSGIRHPIGAVLFARGSAPWWVCSLLTVNPALI